jgi:alkaline phosphatase D
VTDPDTGPSPPEPIPGGADEGVPPLDLAGAWSSNFGTMTVQQDGLEVTGTYDHDGGRIEAILSDHVLAGTWMEAPSYKPDHDSGAFELVFAPDGRSFAGHWRYGFSGDAWDGDWSGTKQR